MKEHRRINDHTTLPLNEGVVYCLIRFHKCSTRWIAKHLDYPEDAWNVIQFEIDKIKPTFFGKYLKYKNGEYKLSSELHGISLDDALDLCKIPYEKQTKKVGNDF